MIPLILWCALGLFSAGSGSAAPIGEQPARSPFACTLAALLLVPLAVMPLAGQMAVTWGHLLLDRGSTWRAAQLFGAAARVQPWSSAAARGELNASRRMGHADRVLVLTEAETRATPSRMAPWMQYGRLLLELGMAEDAVPVLERARPMDPRGPRMGELVMLRAWAQLELGNEAEARALLLQAMGTPGADWGPLPQEVMPPRPGDPETAARIGFRLGGDPERLVPFDDVLEEFGRIVMVEAEVDYVMARRKLGRLVAGYVDEGLPGVALEFVRRYSQLLEPMASIQAMELELLGQIGDFAGAAEAYHGSPYIDHPYMTEAYLRSTRDSTDPEQQREFMELSLDITGGGFTDIFFSAANSAPVYALESERALMRADWAEALHFNGRALYHLNSTATRVRQAARFFERAAELGAPDRVLAEAFGTLMREMARQPDVNRIPERTSHWTEVLRNAWSGEQGSLPELP